MKRLLLILKVLIPLLIVPCYIYAYDFEVDGIAYNKLSGSANEVEVTANKNKYGSNIYSGNVDIPSEVVYSGITYKVTAIGDGAFSGCGHNVKSVKTPNSITRIGNSAFTSLWDITSIEIPNSVTIIGDKAFNDCQSLVTINIPNNVISIGKECFDYCLELRTVSLGGSLKIIGSNAFSRCAKLNSINIPNSVESIGSGTFAECISLTTIDIPNSVKEIGASAFTECSNLKNVTLSHGLSKIDNQLFYNCKNLKSIDIPNSVKSIGNSAFSGCNNLITIQNSSVLQSIGKLAFQNCYYLSSITFPNTLQSIGSQAFYNCPSLSLVISEMTDPFQIDNQFFYIQPGLGIPTQSKTLKIPGGTKQKYIDKGWVGHFNNVIEDIRIYKLVINSLGKGTVTYGTNLIRESSQEYDIEEGATVALTFSPDNCYRIKSVKVNSTDVTSKVSNNSYTISSISANTTLEVEFEAIPIPTYTLSIKATGNGSATYNGTTAKNSTKSFTLNEGASATITFSPDNGYRIKSVKVNSTDVTSKVSNNSYTISSISANTTVEVEFEAIPIPTYTLSIKATGNGSATYNGTTAKNSTKTFTLNEGTSATITFTPDNGYRIKSVKVNSKDVTSSVANNQYTVSNIKANTTVEVEFEAIPIPTYTLSIKATGNGSATYNGTTAKNSTKTFTVNEGTSATITFTPDNGYRIKSVKVNGTNVTSKVSNNSYTISSISANTTLEVEFEAIPVTTYTLSIKATGNGSVSYSGTSAKNNTKTFTVNEGTSVAIAFTPDAGYRIKSVKVNSTDVTSKVSNNSYTISSISANTTVEVVFEAIPIPTYTLSITASGNGFVSYSGTSAKNNTKTFTVNEGTSVAIAFTPDAGYRIKSVKVNSTDVTSKVSNNSYTISSISANTTVEVVFEAIPIPTYTLSITASGNGSVSYSGTSAKNNTKIFTVNEGTSAAIAFTPDAGYRIKSVKVNSTDVTSKVSNSSYTISSINANTTVDVVFEAIPVSSYTLKYIVDGETYKTYLIQEGATITPEAMPTKEGYTFSGWSEIPKTMPANDVTVVGTFTKNEPVIKSFTLTIKATGYGYASYSGITASNESKSYTLNEGTSASISFSPDNGYRIKSVKVNGTDMTSSVSNNSYTVSSIKANTTVEVEFEAIPVTTYNLTIHASGNGSAVYGLTTAKNNSQTITVNQGTSPTITFFPDNGYRIKSVKVNSTDVTSQVLNNNYTISGISADTTVEVEFEAIPASSYTLKYVVDGDTYKTYQIQEGAVITPEAEPEKEGYTFSGWSAIPATMPAMDVTITGSFTKNEPVVKKYTLTITATGNGYASYCGITASNESKSYTLNEGTSASISFSPDNGYRIKSVKVNGTDMTSSVSNNSYTASNIKANTTVEVEFELIPVNIHTLRYVVDGETYKTFQIEEGTAISPEAEPEKEGYTFSGWSEIPATMPAMDMTITGSFIVNKYKLTYQVDGEEYKSYSIDYNAAITPEAEPTKEGYSFSGWSEIPATMPANDVTVTGSFAKKGPNISEQGKTYSIAGVNYEVVSTSDLSVVVATGDYKQTLEIPETITYGGYTWDVIGLKDGALDNCDDLAAIIWEPSVAFNARVKNPNLLLYVKSESYKSLGVRNVVVNGVADNIELTDAASGNDFYCPKAFIARNISYSHHYSMETGLGDAKGWETIVLPFDVKKYTSQKGEIVPFAKWTSTGAAKPFWLCELTANGYREVEGIKANTPYIISMPNNRQYQADYVITGIVTFSAENVEVKASADMQSATYQDRTLVPNYTNKNDENCFALNVKNYYVNNSSTDKDGSKFIKGLRSVHPFEAYMTTTSNTRSIDVFDGMTTAIREIVVETEGTELVKVYDTRGILMKTVMSTEDMRKGLAPGVYIVNGKKMIIK